MKKKIVSIILNPYFLSAIISLVIIYFLPVYFSKYKVELIESKKLPYEGRVYFEDLNSDQIPERIESRINVTGNACFDVFSENGDYIEQVNVDGDFTKSLDHLSFFDIDKNGLKEVFLVTQINDTVFLNVTSPFSPEFNTRKIVVDIITPHKELYNIWASGFHFEKVNNDEFPEFLFSLNAGYSGNPRNIYMYNFIDDKVFKSPHITNRALINEIIDLDGDGNKEILLDVYAAGNKIDSLYTQRTDNSTWLTVLTSDLNFKFHPLEIKNVFSSSKLSSIGNLQDKTIVCSIGSRNKEEQQNEILIITPKGEIIKKLELDAGNYFLFIENAQNEIIIYNSVSGIIKVLDSRFKEKSNYTIYKDLTPTRIDIFKSKDNLKEWILYSSNFKTITIYDTNFKNETKFNLPSIEQGPLFLSLKKGNHENFLCIQTGKLYYIYKYSSNQLYYFKYLVYLGIFLGVYLLVWLIAKGQKMNIEKKLAIENEIAELQLKTIKNQVDPHFVFNAINTISEMTLTDDKLAADDFICKFSNLMRKTLNGSDKISHTLKEELDYVENFVHLQQIRFNHTFEYQLNIDKKINIESIVPKHVLYSYVENAIKHGLSNKANGLLEIHIQNKNKNLMLSIEDNGGGINKTTKTKRNSTGNGLLIMEKIYAMYFKLYKKKISHRLIDVLDTENNIKGLKIEVLVTS